MKRFITYSLILSSLLIFSCKNKSAFTISGTITNPGSLKKIYLLEADSTQVSVIDSTNLSEGEKFQFKHAAPYANLFKLRVGNTIFDFIAQNGDAIDFSTSVVDKTSAYDISGSAESEKIKEFNKISNFYADKSGKISQEYQDKAQALGKESDSLISIYKPLFMAIMNQYSTDVLKFANQNKNSLAGFYAVASLDPTKYEPQLIAYADSLQGKFNDNPAVERFTKQMAFIKPVSVGHQAPDFTIVGIDGSPIKLSDYKGKYVMLDFWASWCAPCRAENPNVVKQYAIYNKLGLNILGISLDNDKGKWQDAVNADKLVWKHASDLKSFDGVTEKLFHIDAIPSNFIINPQGIIIAKNVTGTDLEGFLNKTFNKPQQIVKIR